MKTLSESLFLRKEYINILSNSVKPILALGHCACNNHMEHPAVEISDAAEAEDAIFPDRLQWITKNILFSLGLSVGCVENKRCHCFEQSPWNPFSRIIIQKLVGYAWPNH